MRDWSRDGEKGGKVCVCVCVRARVTARGQIQRQSILALQGQLSCLTPRQEILYIYLM